MTGAGDLRHRLVLEKRAQAPDSGVGLDTTFTPIAAVWGSVRGIRGAVYVDRVQTGEGATHSIRIRYRDAAGFDHLSEGNRRFRVLHLADPTGRREWLDIAAEELMAP